jgi:hypothetical protein
MRLTRARLGAVNTGRPRLARGRPGVGEEAFGDLSGLKPITVSTAHRVTLPGYILPR